MSRISENWQRIKIHNILLKRGLIDEKPSYISDYTGGRTKSTLDMTYAEAMNLINFFEKPQERTVETDKSAKLRKNIFGQVYELNKVAPHLKIANGQLINQEWLSNFFSAELGKTNVYAMNDAERLAIYVKLKQMITGYKKQEVKKQSIVIEKDYEYAINHDK